jgi:hypothetical protein
MPKEFWSVQMNLAAGLSAPQTEHVNEGGLAFYPHSAYTCISCSPSVVPSTSQNHSSDLAVIKHAELAYRGLSHASGCRPAPGFCSLNDPIDRHVQLASPSLSREDVVLA